MVLSGLTKDMWTGEHEATLDLFLKDVTRQMLVVYIDDFAGLKVELVMPHQVGWTPVGRRRHGFGCGLRRRPCWTRPKGHLAQSLTSPAGQLSALARA